MLKLNKNKAAQKAERKRERLVKKYINRTAIKALFAVNSSIRKGKNEASFLISDGFFFSSVELSIVDEALGRYAEFMKEKGFECKVHSYPSSIYRHLIISWKD